MKKIKYIYKHTIYGGGPNCFNENEVQSFFQESGVKLHPSKKDDCFYSWQFAGDSCSWFTFSHTEEVEVSDEVIKLPSENKYKNGYNWKSKGPNARLRKKKPNNLAEEKAQKDAEFFKMREEFLKKQRGES